MSNSEKPPTLIVRRAVTNYGEEEFKWLRLKALHHPRYNELGIPQRLFDRLFKFYIEPKSYILPPEIVVDASRFAEGLEPGHLRRLHETMKEHFAGKQKIEVATLPSEIVDPRRRQVRHLTVAGSHLVQNEHDEAMGLVRDHYGLAELPDGDAEFGRRLTRVTLVAAMGLRVRPLIELAEDIINSTDTPYPAVTEFGKPNIHAPGLRSNV